MKIYKVGGAVRDTLLDYPHTETDWVVVGATPDDLLAKGYTQVGRDFPVFLHPKTKEEYALARTERKQGHGYHGFVVHADPSVTLEQDLERRDLTINAMAMSDDGSIIDPYGGQDDLNSRTLRHVSPHFVEDPLRVLRVARFAARYAHLGFNVADETLALMSDIVAAGELAHLSTERIWVETEKALSEQSPSVYFEVLKRCGALNELLPAVAVTSGIDQLKRAAAHTARSECRWAALLSQLPSRLALESSERIKAPNSYRDLAAKVCEWRPQMKSALADASLCMQSLEGLDALRREEPFDGFCTTLAALEGERVEACLAVRRLQAARGSATAVRAADLASEGLAGPALGQAIRARRVAAIAVILERALKPSND